jgi:hypothetical protein
VNTDGSPLSKSSLSHFPPILFLLEGEKLISLLELNHGHQKPGSGNEFLRIFVEEASSLESNGIHRGLLLWIQIIYLILDAEECEQLDHHVRLSVLEDLSVHIIRDFPIGYQHLVCLRVMRKLLKTWVKPSTSVHFISKETREEISSRVIAMRNSVPSEFVRQPRSLVDLPRLKSQRL